MDAVNCGVWLDGENPNTLNRPPTDSRCDCSEDYLAALALARQLGASAAQEYTAGVIVPALARSHSQDVNSRLR